MIDVQRDVISSSAASQVIGANLPSPLAPMRCSGVAIRSGECTSSASRFTLAQAKPAVNGWSGSPSIRTTRSFSTCASKEHMSGQSCAQTTRTVSTPASRISSQRYVGSRRRDRPSGHPGARPLRLLPFPRILQSAATQTGGPGMTKLSWLGAVAGMALCWSASAADLKIGVASEVTTLDPHYFHLSSNTEIDKLVYSGLITQD